MKVGFIGLGIMGTPMAANLIKGGHQVFLFSIPSVPQSLVDAGGVPCTRGKAVAQQADIIITIVPDTPHVQAALFVYHSRATGPPPRQPEVGMYTSSPNASQGSRHPTHSSSCRNAGYPVTGAL